MEIKLGSKVRDKITGFKGVACGRTEYLWGCISIGVASPMGKDGKVPDWTWFDPERLEVIDGANILADDNPEVTGGPQDQHAPSGQTAPPRG